MSIKGSIGVKKRGGERYKIVTAARMSWWTVALVAAALLVEAVLCDDLTTSAARRRLSRFELGHPDNTLCWDRNGKDGFYSVIDSHNHFRY